MAKDSQQLNVTVPAADREIASKIRERAAALGPKWTVSAFGLEIWRWWVAQGCPAVNAQDQAMVIAGQMAKSGGKIYPSPYATKSGLNEKKK